MTQQNIAPQAFKYVCACGGGMRSLEYLDRHITTAADPTKTTWYSIDGIFTLFGLPEGTHGRLGDLVPQYNTQMGAADFQANVAQWKAFLAERGLGKAAVANTSPDGKCIALTRATGLRCDRSAAGGMDICAPHSARPGRERIVVYPTLVGQVPAPSGVVMTPQTPHVQPAYGAVPAPAAPVAPVADPSVAQGIASIMSQLSMFNSRLTSMEEHSTVPTVPAPVAPAPVAAVPPVPPVEPVGEPAEESVTPLSKMLQSLRGS